MPRAARLLLCLAVLSFPGAARARGASDSASEAAVASAWRRFLLKQFGRTLANLSPNAYSPPEVELGRRIFFDAGLSRDKSLSCSTCHVPERAWTDGLPRALGAGRGTARRELKRKTPSLLNARFKSRFFWDGRAKSVEQAALMAAANPEEMNMPPDDLTALLGASPDYRTAFARVYGDAPATSALAARALGAFVKTVPRAAPSPFDRFAQDRSALTPLQKEGFVLFTGEAHCLRCHGGPFFSTGRSADIGLKRGPGDASDGPRLFVAPPLFDVALTPPYMHDGSLASLSDVVEFYDRGGDEGPDQELTRQDARIVPLNLTQHEKRALVAFLESLGPSPAAPPPAHAPAPTSAQAAPVPASAASQAPNPAYADAPDSGGAQAESAGVDAACVKEFSMGKFMAGAGASRTADDSTGSLGRELASYQAAAAFHAGDPRVCGELKLREGPGPDAKRLSSQCEEEASFMITLRALASRSPDYPALCARALGAQAPGIAAPERAEICALVSAHLDEPRRLCSLLKDRFVFPWQEEACVLEFSAFSPSVEESYCGRDEEGDLLEPCRDAVSYSRARRSGRIEDCGDSPLCKTMMDKRALDGKFDLIRTLACLKR